MPWIRWAENHDPSAREVELACKNCEVGGVLRLGSTDEVGPLALDLCDRPSLEVNGRVCRELTCPGAGSCGKQGEHKTGSPAQPSGSPGC